MIHTDVKQWCNVALHICNTDELSHSEHICMQCCTDKLQNWCAAPKVITNQLQNNSFVSALNCSIENLFAAPKLITDFQNTIPDLKNALQLSFSTNAALVLTYCCILLHHILVLSSHFSVLSSQISIAALTQYYCCINYCCIHCTQQHIVPINSTS